MTASLPIRPTRRSALAGGLAGGLVAVLTSGCDALDPTDSDPAGPGAGPGVEVDPVADPDEALVAEVRADQASAAVLVASALRARPGLAGELAGFATLHARHLRALEAGRPTGRTPVRGNAATLRRRVLAEEKRLQASLASAALAADSGQLATLLASMSAAIAQHLAAEVG